MRLQVSIHRNALPPVQIIFTTGSGPSSHTTSRPGGATIADLLADINDLVPLESSDGEWGLEDYVVEVAATADQEALYECLHFQQLGGVLRDDDEVVVRAIGSDELRRRRLGGRVQISGDGRHLVDGVVWGKRWVRATGRPGVAIPPRKRRRILVGEEEDDGVLALEQAEMRLLEAGTVGSEDEDEDEDGEYEDKENIDYDKAVAVREDFDDADQESEDGSEDVDEDEIQLLLKDAEELDDVDVGQEEDVLERQLKARTRLGKRKRDAADEGLDEATFEGFSTPVKGVRFADLASEEDRSTSGSSSDLASESDADSIAADVASHQDMQIEANILGNGYESETSDSSFDSDADDSSSDEDDQSDDFSANLEEIDAPVVSSSKLHPKAKQQQKKNHSPPTQTSLKKSPAKGRKSKANVSESETSDSDSDESTHSTSSSSTESDFTSSSGSESTSDSDSSSSSDSDSEVETSQPRKTSQAAAIEFANKLQSLQSASPSFQDVTISTSQNSKHSPKPNRSAPGSGLAKTQKKNERTKMKKKLNALKEAGELPSHADFADLRVYEENHGAAAMSTDVLSNELEAARTRLLRSVDEPMNEEAHSKITMESLAVGEQSKKDDIVHETIKEDTVPAATAHIDVAMLDSTPETTATKRSSPPNSASPGKRAKLDVAASRRMLFGSLGLRTPKTPAEEQALREKLAKNVRPEHSSAVKESIDPAEMGSSIDTKPRKPWQEKLIVSAVECVREGMTLPPPPFPFVQNWHKKGKSQSQTSPVPDILHYDGSASPPTRAEAQASTGGLAPDVSTLGLRTLDEDVSNPESRTLSFDKESDGMPIPTDFDALAPLDRSQLVKGTVVAYKEIYVAAETNFQPEVSMYRVAEVDSVDDDGFLTVVLAKRYRRGNPERDPETGEAVSNNFEITDSQEEDDGFRELDFAFMLEPKLVEAAKIQVPESAAPSSIRGGDSTATSQQNRDAVIPESLEEDRDHPKAVPASITVEQLEIDTPRRKEITTIIKDAGFESAMDVQLLEPLEGEQNELPPSSQPVQDVEQQPVAAADGSYQVASQEHNPQGSFIETSEVVIDKSGDNGWSSSSLFPAGDEDGGMEVEADMPISLKEADPSSSPPVSPQLTVEYPHLSQIEIRSSAAPFDDSTRLSSHQDAQRVPAVPPSDVRLPTSVQEPEEEHADEPISFQDDNDLESLRSEVPQAQSQDQQIYGRNEGQGASPSFLGRHGYDGPAGSSYHESDDDPVTSDNDSSSLPSLSELTSSQKWKITTTKTPRANGTDKSADKGKGKMSGKGKGKKDVSPPPIKRNGLTNNKTRNSASSIPMVDGGGSDVSDVISDDEIQFPAPSQRPSTIKVSASQAEKPRSFSQIPLASQVVDLTMSSDPISPDNSDVEYGTGVMRPRRARRSNGAVVNGNGSGRKPKTRAATLGASVSDVGTGLGTKRFLTNKKTTTRSQGDSVSGSAREEEGGYF